MEQASSSALLRLNLETRSQHAAADALWNGLLDQRVTRRDYTDALVSAYGFVAPLEAALAYTPNLKLFVDVRDRSRAGLIAQDLLALGCRVSDLIAIPECRDLTSFAGPLEALGWMYVAQRFSLLHERVRRHLLRFAPEVAAGTAYLAAEGGHITARWNELSHAMDNAVRSERTADELVTATHAGLRCWIAWCGARSAHARDAGVSRRTPSR